MITCDVLIIGAGPAGLHCARILANSGLSVIVLERRGSIGKKVCAGGITWSGLIGRLPESLIERSFTAQRVRTRYQNVRVVSDHPLIATLDRQVLGTYMAEAAREAGASILTGSVPTEIDSTRASFSRKGQRQVIACSVLVGADGSHSRVRSFLGLESAKMGLGLNCMINGEFAEMVWKFDSRKFSSGYAWIFPQRERASVGAYCLNGGFTAKTLRRRLQGWLINQGITPDSGEIRAGAVNCHFCGWNFHPVYLVGDAAGLASPLTGEGIFPAIVSAEAVAEAILGVKQPNKNLEMLLIKRHKHAKLQELANLNPLFSLVLSELSALLLKHRMITFERFEMA